MSDKDQQGFEDLDDFEEFDDDLPVQGEPPMPEQPPGWGKFLAWATIILGGLYIINPTAGILEIIPDVAPIVGNLDEAAILFLMFGAMRYLGMRLPEFIERWVQPLPSLAPPADNRKE